MHKKPRTLWPAVTIFGLTAVFCNSFSRISLGQSGTTPEEGIQSRPARTALFRNAHVTIHAARQLEKADLLIRDGKIVEVASHIDAPVDAIVINSEGKYLYPAFIDPLVEQAISVPDLPDDHWNNYIRPQRQAHAALPVDDKVASQYRRAGFGAVLIVPNDAIIKGSSSVMTTARLPVAQTALRPEVFQHLTLVLPRSERGGYPNSPMGVVALARQTLSDAQWYQQAQQAFRADPSLPTPEKNVALEALADLIGGKQTALIDAGNELYALRADRLAREFNLRAVIRGSGREYRRLDALANTGRTFIVPIDFPKPPEVSTIDAASSVTLQTLMHWYLAPENPGRMEKANIDFVFTANGLTSPSDTIESVRKAISRGLSEIVALDALTMRTARLLEIDYLVGSLERGKLANLIVADGPLWQKKSIIEETWVQGERYRWEERSNVDTSGKWQIAVSDSPIKDSLEKNAVLEMQLEGMTEKPKGRIGLPGALAKAKSSAAKNDVTKDDNNKDDVKKGAASEPAVVEFKKITPADFRIEAMFETKTFIPDMKGFAQLSLTAIAEPKSASQSQVESDANISRLIGRIQWPDGRTSTVNATPIAKDTEDAEKNVKKATEKQEAKPSEKPVDPSESQENKIALDINFPLGAYGVSKTTEQNDWVLVRGATIWTSDAAGVLESADLLVYRGIIKEVGRKIAAPEGAIIIDAAGKHVSAGIIDCHSHMATDGGVNESGQAVTAEVRIGDFIDANDMNIYWQLAGGVTTANILHGSANPIGGQNQVIKLRWGSLDEELKMREAPAGIKFALGENVKQSNWGERATGRYPQSRMGVEQIMRDRFEAAKLYRQTQSEAASGARLLPHRRDYELEAIAEILENRRWIHCHSYRQDEILAFLRTLEDYGVTVGSLQHILEGYKVADAMARHGATGSTFSDWWAYKFEVIDAIPYNAALMHRAGIIVSFNSDDSELARHLNHEAAKAVKYGGISPEEALNFVTINPAKQLRIDQHTGSLAPGKQADFVIWSGSPLSTLSRCEQTWIDGRKYFDRQKDAEERLRAEKLRGQLVQFILESGEKMSGDGRDRRDPSLWFARHDEFCHQGHDHDHDHDRENEYENVSEKSE